MPYRKEQFETGQVYHVVSRAIDDNLIFKDINDYYRGIFSIYEFNNANSVTIQKRREARKSFKKKSGRRASTGSVDFIDDRDKLVEILAFCFMPNHIHLLLKQVKDDGLSKFMAKFGSGYGRYFNQKYQRKGYVFQNRFKSVNIGSDGQAVVVGSYIFTNPIALIEPGWKEFGIRNHSVKEVIKFLENYKWSSYQDSIGGKNFPSVTQREFLLGVMNGEQGCRESVQNWIKHKKDIAKQANLENLALE
jgi:putative transposase